MTNRFCRHAAFVIGLVVWVCTANSLQAQSDRPDEGWRSKYESATFAAPGGQISYRMLRPAKIIAGKKYPLVLFFHGAGERGDDNRKQLIHAASDFASEDRTRDFPAFVIFPQCPAGQRWVESDWDLKSGRGQIPEEPSAAMSLSLELVERLITEQPIDDRRVYVTGLSMGGMAAWFAAAKKPERFAAMLEVCGGSDPDWADRFAGVPIWGFHGQSDRVVPVSRGREMISALTEAGHHPELRFTEYPGVGHNSWTRTFARRDVFEWLFAQSKPE